MSLESERTKELFPDWIGSTLILNELCNNLEWCHVSYDKNTRSVSIGFKECEISEEIPEKEKEVLELVMYKVMNDYIPTDLESNFEGVEATENSINIIKTIILEYENSLSVSIIDYLKIQLGLTDRFTALLISVPDTRII